MKKKLICILLAAAFVFTLTGCKSTLRPALEEYARKSNIAELDLSEMLDEENGFHFGKIKWGMTLTEAGEATESNVSSMLGYGPNDIVVYESSLLIKILGRKNDSASVSTILKQSDVYMISFVFQYNEKYPNLEMPEQKLFEEYLPKLTETFGEPCFQTVLIDVTEVMTLRNRMRLLEKYATDCILFLRDLQDSSTMEMVVYGLKNAVGIDGDSFLRQLRNQEIRITSMQGDSLDTQIMKYREDLTRANGLYTLRIPDGKEIRVHVRFSLIPDGEEETVCIVTLTPATV